MVRRVMTTLRTTPAHRIAVLYGSAQPYARLLAEHFAAAGLTRNGAGVTPTLERTLARLLLDLLALPAHGWRRDEVLSLIARATVRTSDGRRLPAARWERISREAGVVAGSDWDTRLRAWADQQRAEIREDTDEPRRQAKERAATTADELRVFVAGLRAELAHGAELRTWPELAAWGATVFARVAGDLADSASSGGRTEPASSGGRTEPASAGEGTAAGGRAARGREDPADAGRAGRTGHAGGGGRPRCAARHAGAGARRRPAPARHASAGASSSRRCRRASGWTSTPSSSWAWPTISSRAGSTPTPCCPRRPGRWPAVNCRRPGSGSTASTATCSPPGPPRRRRIASFPRGDLRRSTTRLPSRWLLPTLRLHSGQSTLDASGWHRISGAFLVGAASFAAGLAETPELATDQEWRTRAAAAGAARGTEVTVAVGDDTALARAVELLRARRSDRLTRFDGDLTGLGVPDPVADAAPIAPTTLESWSPLPARLLRRAAARHPAGRAPRADHPGQRDATSAASCTRPGPLPPGQRGVAGRSGVDPAAPGPAARHRAAGRGGVHHAGLTGHPLLWREDFIGVLAGLDHLLDAGQRGPGRDGPPAGPLRADFGRDGRPPVELALPDGRALLLRGSADRVDQAGESIVVVDYKTGSTRSFKDSARGGSDGARQQAPAPRVRLCRPGGSAAPPRHRSSPSTGSSARTTTASACR